MSQNAYVETEFNVEGVLLQNGSPIGNLLSNFLAAISVYCMDSISIKDESLRLFIFNESLKMHLCLLANAWYSGEWNYAEEDYDKFLKNSPEMPLSKEDFVDAVRQVNHKWTNLEALIEALILIINFLEHNEIDKLWWYTPGETEQELHALAYTLRRAKNLGANIVRIKIL